MSLAELLQRLVTIGHGCFTTRDEMRNHMALDGYDIVWQILNENHYRIDGEIITIRIFLLSSIIRINKTMDNRITIVSTIPSHQGVYPVQLRI